MDSVVVSVPIVDDDINEAPEQDFVVTLTVETATDPNNIRVTGQDSLCRIRDNDGKHLEINCMIFLYSYRIVH